MAGGMSGIDLARWVRARRPGTRILLTSGFADVAEDEAATGLNIRLLRKPYKRTWRAPSVRLSRPETCREATDPTRCL